MISVGWKIKDYSLQLFSLVAELLSETSKRKTPTLSENWRFNLGIIRPQLMTPLKALGPLQHYGIVGFRGGGRTQLGSHCSMRGQTAHVSILNKVEFLGKVYGHVYAWFTNSGGTERKTWNISFSFERKIKSSYTYIYIQLYTHKIYIYIHLCMYIHIL